MIEEISYGGWERNVRLSDGTAELVVTLDVGPRILSAGLAGGGNLFAQLPEQIGGRGEKEWKIRGGHRFWTAPENDESYLLDNEPVAYRRIGGSDLGIEIVSPQSPFGWQKTLKIEGQGKGRFTVTHTLRNGGTSPIEATPWALSVMAPGGTAILPQPEPKLHPNDLPPGTPFTNDDFQANRRLVLWKYTDLSDPRFRLEPAYWFIRQDATAQATKFGLLFQGGWVAYQLDGAVFAKKIPLISGAAYPDDGCNFELYSDAKILELESLAPCGALVPGAERVHVEEWSLQGWPELIVDRASADRFFQTLKG